MTERELNSCKAGSRNRPLLFGGVRAGLLASALTACLVVEPVWAATLTNYWPISSTTASTAGGLVDTVGGMTATAVNAGTNTDPTGFIANYYSQANEAARVYATTTTSAGFATSLTQLPSSFTYEAVFQYNNNGFNWSYFMGRGAGPIEIAFNNTAAGTSSYWTIRDNVSGNGNTTALSNFSYPAWTANAWYHLAMTYDGATAKLYLTPLANATQVNLLTSGTTALPRTPSSTGGLGLGNSDGNKYSMGIRLDWAAVYNGVLTDAELFTDLQQNSPMAGVPEPGLAGFLWVVGAGVWLTRRRLSAQRLRSITK